MELNEYQERAEKFAKYPARVGLDYTIMGLCGEAGEVANKRKKEIRDRVDLGREIFDELGDVLWYLAAVANELDTDLESIAQYNLKKLEVRHGHKG